MTESISTEPIWLSRSQLLAQHPALTAAVLTNIMTKVYKNGLNEHIHWIEEKPLFNLIGFNHWVKSQPSTRIEWRQREELL